MPRVETPESRRLAGVPRQDGRRRRRRRSPARWAFAIGLVGLPLLVAGGPGDEPIPAVIESPAAAGAVVFPHLYHVEELGIDCRDCHHETAAAPLRMPHPEYLVDYWVECDTCHRGEVSAAQPQSCGACHAPAADIGDQTLSSKVAIHRSCWECHEVGTGAAASRACAFCHEVADEE